ncbi:hypothetical protein ACEPPN_000891 [Leptodophora sp. 'Broadleaf-Isolate-01']
MEITAFLALIPEYSWVLVALVSQLEMLVVETIKVLGKIDLLVPNAGIMPMQDLESSTEADFDRTMRSNVTGPYFLAQNMLLSGFTYDFNCSEALVKLADFANDWLVNHGSLQRTLRLFSRNEEEAEIEMLQKQNSMTDPYPLALLERAGGDWPAPFQVFADMDEDQRERVTWRLVIQELQLPEEDGAFIERVLKIDPAERPTADALLKDKWFAE